MENDFLKKALFKKYDKTSLDFKVRVLSRGLGFYRKKNLIDLEDKTQLNTCDPVLDSIPIPVSLSEDFSYEKWLSDLENPVVENKAQQTFFPYNNLESTQKIEKNYKEKSVLPSLDKTEDKKEEKTKPAIEKPHPFFIKIFHIRVCFSSIIDLFLSALLFSPPVILFVYLNPLTSPDILKESLWLIVVVYLLFYQMYVLLSRSFCLETFGESLVRIRLLKKNGKQPANVFPFLLRFFLSCWTGVIFLPLISLVLKKDMIAHLTGLYFFKK